MDLSRPRRHRTLTRLGATALALVSVLALQSSASADLEDTLAEDTRLPGQGLPGYAQDPTYNGYWISPQAASLNYATAAKQWIKPPVFQAVANNLQTQAFSDPRCTGRLGEGITLVRDYRAPVVFVNTDVSADSAQRFGRTQTFTVRTAAFGAVPVEADIALEQLHNPQGAVLPAILTQRASTFCPGRGPYPTPPPGVDGTNSLLSQTSLTGSVTVRVTGLRVDGVEIPGLATCGTTTGKLALTAPDYYAWNPDLTDSERPYKENILTTKFFNLSLGGMLAGTLDVPDFTSCRTSGGDDVSPLLTAAVSGNGNPVTLRSEGLPPTGGFPDSATEPPSRCPWNSNCDTRLPQLDIPTGEPSP